MSMAVSALVRPSRALRTVLGGAGLAQLAAAVAAGLVEPERFLGAPLLALPMALAAAVLLATAALSPKTHRIDISGIGDLRVTVQQDLCRSYGGGWRGGPARDGRLDDGTGDHAAAADASREEAGMAAVLLPGSVVWPVLMLLRWRGQGARTGVLHVWRDSVDAATWRALTVALAASSRAGMAGAGEKIR